MNTGRFTQLSFSFCGFLGQNMTTVRLTTFKTIFGFFKPFSGTAMALHFWHLFSPIIIKLTSLRQKPDKAKCMARPN
jgi:hypothetical protein